MDGYDIDFARRIRDEIHERAFYEFTSIYFPCLIKRLYDVKKVSVFPDIDHRVKATRTTDIGFIRNDANLIPLYKAQPSASSGATHFEGLSILSKYINRLIWVAILI